jgi:COMPASS component SWD3
MTIGDSDTSVFSCKFDAHDKYLAAGYGDGVTRIYNVDTQKLAFTLYGVGGNEEMPVTDIAWRPITATMKTANVLVTAQADGTLKHWHATSGKCLHEVQEDPENHIYTLDFKPDGTLLAAAGRDRQIWVYDETTKSLAFKMKEKLDLPGHSNRIFNVKWNHVDQNQVVSGGWDMTIQIYDIRARGPVAYIYGPQICGDSICFRNDGRTMVTGSYRWVDVLEVWDLRKMARTRIIDWDGTGDQVLYSQDSETDISIIKDGEESKS